MTGGDQQAGAILCGVPWTEARALVEQAVIDAEGLQARQVGEASPWYDPQFAGNPCAIRYPEDSSVPTVPEGD